MAEDGDEYDPGMFVVDEGGFSFSMERAEAEKMWHDLGRLLGKGADDKGGT